MCELFLFGKGTDGFRIVREESGEGVEIIVVDLRDVRVGYYDEGEVSKGLYSMGESDWEEAECEVCRCEQSFFGERGPTISWGCQQCPERLGIQ